MCVIAVAKTGTKLAPDVVASMFENNSHGAGMAFIKDGNVTIRKGYMDKAAYLEAYNEHYEKYGKDNPMLLHCRIRTHGAQVPAMTHPFELPHGDALVHNGSFSGLIDKEKSDTCIFVNRVGHLFTKDVLSNDAVVQAVGRAIGHNKMAVLHADGSYTIFNEQAGTWKGDVWYSNLYWEWKLKSKGSSTASDADPWASFHD